MSTETFSTEATIKQFFSSNFIVSKREVSTWIKEGSVAMLAAKWSAGVAPEVNPRHPFNTSDKSTQVTESTLALKPRTDVTRSPKHGYQLTHKKD